MFIKSGSVKTGFPLKFLFRKLFFSYILYFSKEELLFLYNKKLGIFYYCEQDLFSFYVSILFAKLLHNFIILKFILKILDTLKLKNILFSFKKRIEKMKKKLLKKLI